MKSISVTDDVREELLILASKLQLMLGRRVDFNDAIRYLLLKESRKPELLERATKPVGGFRKAYGELIRERRRDERLSRRKYGS